METIECSKCGAIFEKTGAKDKLRRFKDKRFMTTFHCPNCDARVILKNGEEPDTLYLKRLERLKEQARRLGDRQEVNELQDEIDQINREIKMNAGKTRDKKFSMKGKDAYDPTKPKNIAKAKALSVAQGKAASDASSYALSVLYELKSYHNIPSNQGQKLIEKYKGDIDRWEELKITPERSAKQLIQQEGLTGFEKIYVTPDAKDDVNYLGEKVFHTYESWKVACKRVNPNVVFEGDRDICEAKPGVGQWDGVTGVIYKTDDEAYDPLDPENIAEEKELAKARGVAAADEKIISINTPKWSGDIKIVDNTHFEMKAEGTNKWSWAYHIGQADDHILNALKAKGMLKDNGRFFITDSLFKGQKVTAIKSEQGLREGETYTVLGEEAIIKQVVGEGNTIVYKLQDSSGNVIVIENPEGLFYEVKDVKAKDSDTQRELLAKLAEKAGDKEYADDIRSGKVPSSMIAERINYYQTKVGDSEENESLKVKIGEIKKNMDAARKMGYDTEPYQKEIDKLETKDVYEGANIKNGYYAAMTGKARTENPFTKSTPEYTEWDRKWKIGNEDFKYESNKELFKPKDSDDKELKEMLVNDAPDYYGAIVATARRGNNPRMGVAELRKNIEPFMTAHGVQFNEEEFNKAYKEFSHAGVSKAAFMKGTDSKTKDTTTKNIMVNGAEVKVAVDVSPKWGTIYRIWGISNIPNSMFKSDIGWNSEARLIEEVKKLQNQMYGDSKDSSDIYTKDPLTMKGQKILAAMKKVYGEEKGEQVFYASKNKGTISGVDGKTKDEEVHLSGSINKDKSVIDRLLRFWEGQYSGQTDKGAIFKFKNESDANGFRKDIKKQVFSVFVDSKTKDQEIKITIGEDPVNPNPAEQKVEGNDILYKEYTLKQLPETGEFEIYSPGGTIIGHAKALGLAKLFVDRIVASKIEG